MNRSELEYIGNDVSPSDKLKFVKKKKKRKKIKRKRSDSVYSVENSIESSDDDKPLAVCRRIKQGNKQYSNKSKNETDYISKSCIKNKSNNKKSAKSKKKVYQYKNGKKVFCQSDSESTDFEKYIYFDESKTKRKIKLPPELNVDELGQQIQEIKMENVCLLEEHNRINEIKLKERLKLRMEIGRLKTFITELKLSGFFNSGQIPEVGNTTTLIETLKSHINDDNLSKIENNKVLHNKIKSLKLTDSTFWQDFNSTEHNSKGVNSTALWTGNLDNIHPNSDIYYKPNDYMKNLLSVKFDPENQNPASNHNRNNTNIDKSKSHTNDISQESDSNDSTDESTESFSYNPDWNELATKRKLKKLELQNKLESELREENDLNLDIRNNASENETDDFEANDVDIFNISEEQEDDVKSGKDLNDVAKNSDNNICAECGMDSSWSTFVARHREAYKLGAKLPPCNTCNLKFLKSGHFDGRHRLKRPPAKKFRPQSHICDVCGQGCTTRSGLSQHRLRHAEARYSCPHCPYKCRRKGYMKKHVETHVREMNSSKAKAADTEPSRLDAAAEERAVPEVFTDKDLYRCGRCNYRSPSMSYLNMHIKYHSVEKPFKCDQCPYQCNASSRLATHKKTHSNKVTTYNYYESCNVEYNSKDNVDSGVVQQPNFV
ncbi:uncharacterized protein LOC143909491 [Arctopsyche grandis]|uniref:uncharacterized protein LOC143909491 n=1 Tax=Arctopsyche grandis TaxID=121162 RepID=UPI00406D9191